MITSPTIDDLLEGVIIALEADVLPALDQPKAQASVQMIQSILQGVRQLLPVYEPSLVLEHNEMNAALRDAAEKLADVVGPEAERVRERAATIGGEPDMAPPADAEAVRAAHRQRTEAVRDCVYDLDVLQREGIAAADESLTVLRAMLTSHYLNYMATFPMQGGMLGRG
ncbi:MAG: hypothetical protein ACKVIQ_17370 [Acidimicrobiales bacterium]|jgi:hypothetical protein